MKIIRNLLIFCLTVCVGYMLCGYAYSYWTQQVSVRGDMTYTVTYHIVDAQANTCPNVSTATEPLKAGSTVNPAISQATPEPTGTPVAPPTVNEESNNQLVGSESSQNQDVNKNEVNPNGVSSDNVPQSDPSLTPSLTTSN